MRQLQAGVPRTYWGYAFAYWGYAFAYWGSPNASRRSHARDPSHAFRGMHSRIHSRTRPHHHEQRCPDADEERAAASDSAPAERPAQRDHDAHGEQSRRVPTGEGGVHRQTRALRERPGVERASQQLTQCSV